MIIIIIPQNELDCQQKKKKETEEQLRDLGKEVKELEPKHIDLKRIRDEKKKLYKAVTVSIHCSSCICSLT